MFCSDGWTERNMCAGNMGKKHQNIAGWWFLKNQIYGKIKNVPNHQPDRVFLNMAPEALGLCPEVGHAHCQFNGGNAHQPLNTFSGGKKNKTYISTSSKKKSEPMISPWSPHEWPVVFPIDSAIISLPEVEKKLLLWGEHILGWPSHPTRVGKLEDSR